VLLAIVFGVGLFSAPYFAAQRTIVPELFGEDETAVTRASAFLGGATQLTMIAGPAIAGALIAAIGAPAVLLVDAATYLFAFGLVFSFVRAGARSVQADAAHGLLAGVRYVIHDRLLGPLTLTVILLDMTGNALFASLPLLAFTRFHRDAHVAGWLFAAFGIGAFVGSVAAARLAGAVKPARLMSGAVLLAVAPLWLLVASLPALGVGAVLLVCGLFVPLVNAPAMALLTLRPPRALRAKVMTAVITASALGGPAGRLVVGPLYRFGTGAMYAVIAAAFSVAALVFAAAALRGGETAEAAAAPG
jgi:predicted MFS family arabinose efflux permease